MPTATRKTRTTNRSKPRPRLTPEERAERLEAARQQLLDGVDALMTSEGWKLLVTSRPWLRRYSFNNVLMILQQCPHATDVRPMSEWREAGYPLMRKGTHKIKIWKPVFRKSDSEDTNRPGPEIRDANGNLIGTNAPELSGFMLVPVVDSSQLQGVPAESDGVRPTPVELSGDAPAGLWDGIAEQITTLGYRIERADCSPAYGVTNFDQRRVVIRPNLADSQAAKTLTHELAHILCNHDTRWKTATRDLLEVEAESVACIVTAACGLNALDYSVPYVASWADDRDTVRKSAERILTVADKILERLEASGVTAIPSHTASDEHQAA
ncbi:ImmA/IrrE family metallo-endopeptidase [Actinophytocola oryzae]|uniref:Uncharacterized protein DUF955 n=1 Tax=Actinophytocola oryzae TaxID=502181 RepID=A0A4R7V483_9PSEU|nr:ImmA/IrrE family metallo-endopeptidase [Actinophytocola oryzae]TDV44159.1 uncharacterized protein DUF955 [Actinophytocola oryzae]